MSDHTKVLNPRHTCAKERRWTICRRLSFLPIPRLNDQHEIQLTLRAGSLETGLTVAASAKSGRVLSSVAHELAAGCPRSPSQAL